MPLPRRFLNDDEELLVELRPHWVFFAGPMLAAAGAVAVAIAISVAASPPNWVVDGLFILAAIPVLWFGFRLLRWRFYTLALTTTRILLRRGVFDRDIVQLRLQRITEINLSQKLWERVISTGRLIVDVQGEDDAVVLQFVRKPAIVQRVINGQINELIGGGSAEPIPSELRNIDSRSARSRPTPAPDQDTPHDTPPFGTPAVAFDQDVVDRGPTSPQAGYPMPPTPGAPSTTTPAAGNPYAGGLSGPSEIRDRLIELDDLRRRGIISEEEFAAKKAELLSRI